MSNPLPQGATIGILGGGQLGRMLSVAAARLGYKSHIFEPGAEPPAAEVCHVVTTASYDDEDALETFADSVDVITYEFENIPTAALDRLEGRRTIRPGREALRVSQDRLIEKEFLQQLGLTVAPFADVIDAAGLQEALETMGGSGILKTRRFGYDGKGQVRLSKPDDLTQALEAINHAPAILEGLVNFSCEISVIAARGVSGETVCYDPGENVHRDGILRTTRVPSQVRSSILMDAVLAASRILQALDYVGVMGVEFFVTDAGLVVNEIAPRVHNSGHWTQNGCVVDQFEQHIRAITGLPLGDGTRIADVDMENLIGHEIDAALELAGAPNAALHLYGKSQTKPGRKMGHINRVRHL